MKTRLIFLAFGLAGFLGCGVFRAQADLEVSAGISIHNTTEFVEPLATHGAWVTVGTYGRCWHPAGVVVGWRPYCDGHWEWTDCGWYWVSDEPWAWACYHYGSWAYDSQYGWVWVPGVEWAPAWVYWRTGGDYIGWVPCGPPGFVPAPSFYVFVQSRHFHDRVRPNTVIVNNTVIINKTVEIKNVRREKRTFDGRSQTVVVNEGPRVRTVEKATGQKFTAVPVREADHKTFVSVPERLKHQNASPVSDQKNRAIQEQPKPSPDRNHNLPNNFPSKKEMPGDKIIVPEKRIPSSPPERVIPPAGKGLPDKEFHHPTEIIPPHQPAPPGNPGNERIPDKDTDKDRGHDHP